MYTVLEMSRKKMGHGWAQEFGPLLLNRGASLPWHKRTLLLVIFHDFSQPNVIVLFIYLFIYLYE